MTRKRARQVIANELYPVSPGKHIPSDLLFSYWRTSRPTADFNIDWHGPYDGRWVYLSLYDIQKGQHLLQISVTRTCAASIYERCDFRHLLSRFLGR